MPADQVERTGSSAATFASFYRGAYDEVYRALALTLRDPQLTADAVQEALARAYARWDEVSEFSNPVGWVYRVALNWARSGLRRRMREVLVGRPHQGLASEMPEPADPAVVRALRGLPVGQRAVVVLRLYLDWSVEEVATALDVPTGTVKSRQARAVARLREHLEVSP